MARVLLALGAPDARATIEARAGRSSGDLKRRLQELLTSGPGPNSIR
jgi:hypothetical protein